jgi:hypothetical protein
MGLQQNHQQQTTAVIKQRQHRDHTHSRTKDATLNAIKYSHQLSDVGHERTEAKECSSEDCCYEGEEEDGDADYDENGGESPLREESQPIVVVTGSDQHSDTTSTSSLEHQQATGFRTMKEVYLLNYN